jgi:hypothetical protein
MFQLGTYRKMNDDELRNLTGTFSDGRKEINPFTLLTLDLFVLLSDEYLIR